MCLWTKCKVGVIALNVKVTLLNLLHNQLFHFYANFPLVNLRPHCSLKLMYCSLFEIKDSFHFVGICFTKKVVPSTRKASNLA